MPCHHENEGSSICLRNPCTVGGKYKTLLQIGSGAFGKVYLAIDDKNEKFAIKVDRRDTGTSTLAKENHIYRLLKKGSGFPRTHWCGCEKEDTFLVMDLLGLSLSDLHERSARRFSLKTILLLADQIIDRLEFVHNKFLLHRDIKPANFLIGTGDNQHIIHLADFGLSERYQDFRFKHIPNDVRHRVGTPVFASLNVHYRNTPSRRDDLESVAYMLINFYKGSLPWQHVTARKTSQTWDKVGAIKMTTPLQELCEGCPSEFRVFLAYCRQLGYDSKPNYSSIKTMFRKLAQKNNIEYDYVFDWSKKNEDEASTSAVASAKAKSNEE